MMSNNKILTVSYGTFSCTLEGFDDSFGTMKAIAEYFRDLSADDRYFGAEPAQPDAEMLTRIAEREISRRVEAREHDGRIVLSASDAQMASPSTAPAVASVGAAAVTAQVQVDAPASDDAAVRDTTHDETDADTDDAIATAVADKVENIEVDVADKNQADTSELIDDVIADDVEVIEDEAVEAFFADTNDIEDIAEHDIADQELITELPSVADTIEPQADVATPDDVFVEDDVAAEEDVVVEDDAKQTQLGTDSIAAKLQRIRAVVSQGQKDVSDDELFEDQHAEDADAGQSALAALEMATDSTEADRPDPSDVLADAARDIEDAAQVDEDTATMANDVAQNDEDDDLAAMLARLDTGDAKQTPVAEEAETVAKDIETDADDLGLDTLAALMAADDDTSEPDDVSENLFDDNAADEEIEVEDPAEDVEAPQVEAAPVTPRRARIVKVKRADIDAALASGQLEEIEDDKTDSATSDTTSSLSEQEEAELLADLAEVETELTQDTTDDDQVMDIAAERATKVADEIEVKDDDVSRLMAEADNQMDEPEGSGRRNAFAHLKAAVMAKKADADLGNDSIKDEDAFRSDLASVVKPRRPTAGRARAERPEDQPAAPLKLVAEQRVDVETTNAGPVRPRRIAAIEEPEGAVSAEGTFADYAADQGAHDLPALLEAAASYLSFVEGRDQFSRPQLMNKVRQVEKDDFSREDGLRSFGQLLRAGKIEKTKGGRFAVTGDIGFRPDERAAG